MNTTQDKQIVPSISDSHNDHVLLTTFQELTIDLNTEGFAKHFYGDTKGIVTIGIGHATSTLKEALALPLSISGRKATSEEITESYNAVEKEAQNLYAKNPKKMPDAGHYKALNKELEMEEKQISTFFEKDTRMILRELKRAFLNLSTRGDFNPRFKTLYNYPFPAQLALLDMAFNMGVGGLLGRSFGFKNKQGFPMMLHAIRKYDFAQAAKQSRRPEVSEERNHEIYSLFQKAQTQHEAFSKALQLELESNHF